jgi:hypothetical protein
MRTIKIPARRMNSCFLRGASRNLMFGSIFFFIPLLYVVFFAIFELRGVSGDPVKHWDWRGEGEGESGRIANTSPAFSLLK